MKILKTGTLLKQSRDFGRTSERKKKEKARTTNLLALRRKAGQVRKNLKRHSLTATQKTSLSLISRAQKIPAELLHLRKIKRKALRKTSLIAPRTLVVKLLLAKK